MKRRSSQYSLFPFEHGDRSGLWIRGTELYIASSVTRVKQDTVWYIACLPTKIYCIIDPGYPRDEGRWWRWALDQGLDFVCSSKEECYEGFLDTLTQHPIGEYS